MKAIQLIVGEHRGFNHFRLLLGLLLLVTVPCNGQVTWTQLTNGLVSYYPLDQLVPGTTNQTPDVIGRRDLTMYLGSMAQFQNGPAAIVAGSHPGMGNSTAVMNLPQTPAPTVLVYQSTGQNPLDGSGDFLPFINQRNATMNFWIKGNVPGGNDQRVMAECANNGDNNPFFSLSTQPSSRNNNGLGYFLREAPATTDPNGVSANLFPDGTYQDPAFNYIWSQSSQYTTNVLFDNNWHMLTTVISSNGDVHVFVDGNYDPGNQSTVTTDNEGNPALAPPLNVTNTYYNTNIYPFGPVTTNGGPGLPYVHWMIPGLNLAGAFTTFGGFDRNGGIAGGPPIQLSDIGFWNRTLSPAEIKFVMTNSVPPPGPLPTPPQILSFTPDFYEVGSGDQVALNWNVVGASNISISGLGDVTALGFAGSTNVTISSNTTFTLTAANGLVEPRQATISIKAFPGVSPDWHLIQRFDGLFGNTSQGINGNGWVRFQGTYLGPLDRFNVVTVNSNEMLSPKSGYLVDSNSVPFHYDTTGALAYGVLNGLSFQPYQTRTLFFRFSLRDPASLASAFHVYSGLDFKLGVTDNTFVTGPLTGANPPNNYTPGPGIHISRYDPTGYTQVPFDLEADNYNGSNFVNSYSYIADTTNGSASGLQMNVNYMAWLDISNTLLYWNACFAIPNTTNLPVFGLWLQAQGQAAPVQLFSGYANQLVSYDGGCNCDCYYPNILNKIFVSVGTESFTNGDYGAFFETNNMIVLDDFYLSKNGYDHTIPRLFQISSITRAPTTATINWYSLGSLFQTNTYSVQRKFNLTDPGWTTLTNGLPSGGDFTSFTDSTLGSANTAFYRISWP